MTDKHRFCIDCREPIYSGKRAKRCRTCARKIRNNQSRRYVMEKAERFCLDCNEPIYTGISAERCKECTKKRQKKLRTEWLNNRK